MVGFTARLAPPADQDDLAAERGCSPRGQHQLKRALHTHDLGKLYDGGKWGARHISLDLDFGVFVGVLGANGAGKSTLIHLLCGALNPTTGTLAVGGDPPARIGWCSQRQSMDWYLNVENNVLLGPRLAGMGRAESRSSARDALEVVGLSGVSGKAVDELSGGQQQRVQIARALAQRPDILLLDEPSSGLDVEAADALLDHLKDLSENGKLVVVSSHDLGLLETRCDLILLLAEGQAVTLEPPEGFLRRFADDEVIEVSYDRELSADRLEQVRQVAKRVDGTSPLRLVVERGTSIPSVLDALGGTVTVRDVRRESPGLREAYLAFARGGNGGLQAGGEQDDRDG